MRWGHLCFLNGTNLKLKLLISHRGWQTGQIVVSEGWFPGPPQRHHWAVDLHLKRASKEFITSCLKWTFYEKGSQRPIGKWNLFWSLANNILTLKTNIAYLLDNIIHRNRDIFSISISICCLSLQIVDITNIVHDVLSTVSFVSLTYLWNNYYCWLLEIFSYGSD